MSIIKRPRIYPLSGQQPSNDTLWFIIDVFEMTNQNVSSRSKDHITKKRLDSQYQLLAQMDFMENISHDWSEYEAIATKATSLMADVDKQMNVATDTAKGASTGSITNTSILEHANFKVDSPLVYKGSARREYMLTFQFADQGNVQEDVMRVVDDFKKYSAASIKTDDSGKVDNTSINYPYTFTVRTFPVPFIHIENAIIASMQPQYYGPYRNGYPTKCDLNISFKDMQPLYRETWTGENRITTDKVVIKAN